MTHQMIQKRPYHKPLCATMAVQTAPLLQLSGVQVGDRKQVEGAPDVFESCYKIEIADRSQSAWGEVEVD